MRPGNYPLSLYRGDTYVWQFVCYASEGVAANLSGATAKAEIRDRPGGQLLTAMTCVITQPNIITVTLKTINWAPITTKTAAWDLQLTYADANATVVTILYGAVTITADVTDTVALPATAGFSAARRVVSHG